MAQKRAVTVALLIAGATVAVAVSMLVGWEQAIVFILPVGFGVRHLAVTSKHGAAGA